MLLVIFSIGLIVLIIGIMFYRCARSKNLNLAKEERNDDFGTWPILTIVLGVVICIVALIAGTTNLIDYVNAQTYPERIRMYEQENAKIESSISIVVENYMSYEKDTYEKLSVANMDTTNIMALVSLFPTLSSDKLVQSQIDTLVSNNQSIKALKESQISAKQAAWWLFFGSLT